MNENDKIAHFSWRTKKKNLEQSITKLYDVIVIFRQFSMQVDLSSDSNSNLVCTFV